LYPASGRMRTYVHWVSARLLNAWTTASALDPIRRPSFFALVKEPTRLSGLKKSVEYVTCQALLRAKDAS